MQIPILWEAGSLGNQLQRRDLSNCCTCIFLGIRCLWVILSWHSDRPPTLHPSAAFPGPSPHAVQESPRKPRLLPKAHMAHALGEPGCLLGTRRSLSAPIPKPQEVSSTSTPPPGLPCSIARLLMHKPFATATCCSGLLQHDWICSTSSFTQHSPPLPPSL